MNKRYLIIIFALINFNIILTNFYQFIEEEKNISTENKIDKINRDFELYEYYVSFGQSVPIGTNLTNNFKTGNSLSIVVKTPYRITKVFNIFDFNLSSEIFLKNYKYKRSSIYNSNYNANGFYIILEPENLSTSKINYGIGLCHMNQGSYNKIAPILKLNLETEINLIKFYDFLSNINLLNKNTETRYYIEKIELKIGTSPELFLGFPGKQGDWTSGLDLYMKLNLFNL